MGCVAVMDRIFFTVFDPDTELHWCNDNTLTSNVMDSTWFAHLEAARQGLILATRDAAVHERNLMVPMRYEVIKHELVSERLSV